MSEVFGLGCIPSPPDPGDADYHIATLGLPPPTLPVTVPLPPGHPWDQWRLGTCVGNGTGLACVIAIHRATGQWIVADAAAGELLAKDLYHLANPGDSTYREGAIIREALRGAKNVGVRGANGVRHRIKSYHSLLPSSDINGDVERALAAGMAVVTGWRWPEAWMAPMYPFDTLPEPGPDPAIAGGHCVAIWRAAMKHPAAGVSSLRRDHSIENSWDKRWTVDGAAYFDAALERGSLLFDAWCVQA